MDPFTEGKDETPTERGLARRDILLMAAFAGLWVIVSVAIGAVFPGIPRALVWIGGGVVAVWGLRKMRRRMTMEARQ